MHVTYIGVKMGLDVRPGQEPGQSPRIVRKYALVYIDMHAAVAQKSEITIDAETVVADLLLK